MKRLANIRQKLPALRVTTLAKGRKRRTARPAGQRERSAENQGSERPQKYEV